MNTEPIPEATSSCNESGPEGSFDTVSSPHLDNLLAEAVTRQASDLHIIAGLPPAFRVHGEIVFADEDALTPEAANGICHSLLVGDQLEKFAREWELCVSVPHSAGGRIRATL